VVNLANQSLKVRNDLIREIVFLEKLKHCSLVVRAFDYELRETETEYKMLVLMEKGDRDLYSVMEENRERQNLTPAKLRSSMFLTVLYWY
jgi:serine/threonine protein kinase